MELSEEGNRQVLYVHVMGSDVQAWIQLQNTLARYYGF